MATEFEKARQSDLIGAETANGLEHWLTTA
jgi:hypothetical protein